MKHLYVYQLPDKIQSKIIKELGKLGLTDEEIQTALDSKVSDLTDTLSVEFVNGMF